MSVEFHEGIFEKITNVQFKKPHETRLVVFGFDGVLGTTAWLKVDKTTGLPVMFTDFSPFVDTFVQHSDETVAAPSDFQPSQHRPVQTVTVNYGSDATITGNTLTVGETAPVKYYDKNALTIVQSDVKDDPKSRSIGGVQATTTRVWSGASWSINYDFVYAVVPKDGKTYVISDNEDPVALFKVQVINPADGSIAQEYTISNDSGDAVVAADVMSNGNVAILTRSGSGADVSLVVKDITGATKWSFHFGRMADMVPLESGPGRLFGILDRYIVVGDVGPPYGGTVEVEAGGSSFDALQDWFIRVFDGDTGRLMLTRKWGTTTSTADELNEGGEIIVRHWGATEEIVGIGYTPQLPTPPA